MFVVVCWSSPGYKPFIASLLEQGPPAPPDRQIVLRDGMPTLFVATREEEKRIGSRCLKNVENAPFLVKT